MEQTKKKFLKNVVGFSLTTWISFAIGLLASPVVTRLFSTAEMGKLNMFSVYATLFAATCYLGLDQAYVRFFREPPGKKSTPAGMFTFCAATSLGFAVLVALILLVGWRGISEQVVLQPDFGVYLCLAIYGFCLVQFRYLSLSYRMEQNARLYTIQGVIQVILTKLVYLAVAFRSAEAKPAILLLTVLMGAFTLIFTWIQRRRFDAGFLKKLDRPFVRDMALYAAPLIPLAMMSWLNSSISLVVLRNLMDISAVGIYTSALMISSAVNVIQSGFNTYWAPYVYEHYQNDDKSRFYTVHRLMACLLTGFGLTITLLQAPVYLLLGAAFRGSVVYFPFLFLTPICYCLSETTGMGIGIAKKSYWNTIVFLLSALVNLGFCFVLIPFFQATGAAMAAAAAAIAALVIRTAVGERYYKAIADYRYVAYTVGLMLAASLCNYFLRDAALWKYVSLLAVYGIALYLFRGEIKTLWNTARQIGREGTCALRRRAAQADDKGDRT
ncbi:MAG: lipopolysaccharide biosynthesis protein [Eubacteriales bacterium]|nr:lipopolysaccharide biosynthesis protein [Eubacteriales bacterium]